MVSLLTSCVSGKGNGEKVVLGRRLRYNPQDPSPPVTYFLQIGPHFLKIPQLATQHHHVVVFTCEPEELFTSKP